MGRAKEIEIRVIPSRIANPFIKAHHYSGKVVNNSCLHFGAFLDGRLHGVLSYGPSLDKKKIIGLVEGTTWDGFLELNRMAFDDYLPRNSESYCIAKTIRLIKKQAPQVKWVISFADGCSCGDGTIYRACNFVLTDIKRNDALCLLPNGDKIHKMTLHSNPTNPRPELGGRSFYDVNGGEIRVSGEKITNLTRRSLRQNFGMVLQDTWIKTGTVRENIALGKPDATQGEIVAAAKACHADGFIRRLPDGYDTVITDGGGLLSQGQRQLLCIARVMLALPPMLILDEATSSIDTRTELKIQHAFSQMMKGRTSFIVAHRLSTIREADVILVMKDGHVIEQGRHEQLLAQNGFYAKLYNSQFEQ